MKESPQGGTRERILMEAQALFAEAGYHGAGLQEIARRAGLRKASLFHHFASKADLYRSVLALQAAETERLVRSVLESEASPADKVSALVEAYVDLVAAHPQPTKILLRRSLDDAGAPDSPSDQPTLKMLVDFVQAGQRSGVFAPTDPVAFVLGLIGSVTFLFTSASAFAPAWPSDTTSASTVARVKQYAREQALRHLLRTN